MNDEMKSAEIRLATYGTLSPGQPNHHQLSGLRGDWLTGTVRGFRRESGWGAAMGYPGIVLDDAGDEVAVHVLESDDLPNHWDRLDEFEGEGYCRKVTFAKTSSGLLTVSIYELAPLQDGAHQL